jgi:hypothetical protein
LNDDIAVIRLRTSITIDSRVSLVDLAPANLNDQELVEGDPLVAAGWGVMTSVNFTYPQVLQQVRLQYVPWFHPQCESRIGFGRKSTTRTDVCRFSTSNRLFW